MRRPLEFHYTKQRDNSIIIACKDRFEKYDVGTFDRFQVTCLDCLSLIDKWDHLYATERQIGVQTK